MIGALAAMGAGVLGQGIANHVSAQNAARSQNNENQRRQEAVTGVQTGLEAGASKMADYVNNMSEQAKNDPAYKAELMRGYDSYNNNNAVGTSFFGQPTSSSDALAKLYGGLQSQTVNAVQYDPTNINAQLANTSTASATSIGRDAKAAQLQDTNQQTLAQQYALRDQMQQRAFGLTPSIAQQQLAMGLDQAQTRQAGLAAATRGGMNSLLAMRQAQNMGGQAMQDVARESALLAMQERAQAEQAYGGLMAGLRSDSTQRDMTQAGYEQSTELANLGKRTAQAQMEAARKQSNASALTQGSQYNAGLMNQANQYNATNQMNANRDYANQQFSANATNVGNDANMQTIRANALANAIAADTEGRMRVDQFNVGQLQNANNNNAQWLNALQQQGLGYAERGAFAGATANQAALGVDMTRANAPSVGESILSTVSPILMQQGSNALASYLPVQANNNQPNTGAF